MIFNALKSFFNLRSLLYAFGSVMTGVLLRRLLNVGYRATKGGTPPEDPSKFHTSGTEALVWTIVLSLASGLGKLAYKTIVTEPKEY
ncbi:MAG: hypothetical protein WBA74_27265 [Cyclobacteriaceae bacterium]